MTDKAKIQAALQKMDPADDTQWSDDGMPLVSVVRTLADDESIKRSDINAAAPNFSREKLAEALSDGVAAVPAADGGAVLAPVTDGDLTAAVEHAEQALFDARKAVVAAQRAEQNAVKALDAARKAYEAQHPPLSHSENIKQYLDAEKRKRAAAANAGDVYGATSQIDRAMAGRRAPLGWGRPQVGRTARPGAN